MKHWSPWKKSGVKNFIIKEVKNINNSISSCKFFPDSQNFNKLNPSSFSHPSAIQVSIDEDWREFPSQFLENFALIKDKNQRKEKRLQRAPRKE